MNGESLDNELRDIQGYQALIVPTWFWWFLGLLAFALLAFFVYKYVISKKQEIELTIFEKTIQDLEALDVNQASKEFYLDYSDIVRTYLLERVDLNLFDKTLNELRSLFDKNEVFDMQSKNQLLNIFAKADMAKFAKRDISAEKRLEHLDKTKEILSKVEVKLEEDQESQSKIEIDEKVIEEVEA